MKQAKLPCAWHLACSKKKPGTASNPRSLKPVRLASAHGGFVLDTPASAAADSVAALLSLQQSAKHHTAPAAVADGPEVRAGSQDIAAQQLQQPTLGGQQLHPTEPHMHRMRSTLSALPSHTPRSSAAHASSHQVRWRHTGRKPKRYTPAQAATAACRGQLTHKHTCSARHTHGRSHSTDYQPLTDTGGSTRPQRAQDHSRLSRTPPRQSATLQP